MTTSLIEIGELNKVNLESISNKIMESKDVPEIETYIKVKAVEQIVKFVTSNTDFRKRVKESFLTQTQGLLDKTSIMGVTIKPRDLSKQEMLKDVYMYSDEINNLEIEIQNLEEELSLKKDILKQRKLLEINSGTAVKVTMESVLGEQIVEAESLKNFDISVSFPSGK